MKAMNPKVDAHLRKAKKWQAEMEQLRKILVASPLTEEWKWDKPCYTFENTNLVVICALKESCALGFMKGALLKDPKGLLIKPGENSQSMRWFKFTGVPAITKMKATLKAYIQEAIDAEKAGLKINFTREMELVFPEEFQKRLNADSALKTAFAALTPGRQRGYNLFFSGAKQSATRAARVEKCVPLILKGRGLHDR